MTNAIRVDGLGNATFVGSLTTNTGAGVVFSNSAGLLTSSNGTSGQMIIGGGSGPSWATLTSPNSSVTFTNGANSLGVDINNYNPTAVAFTPILAFGGASVGVTYGTRQGSYVRIGSCVNFTINIVLTNRGSSAGAMSITGLPFSSAIPTALTVQSGNLTYVLGSIQCAITGNVVTVSNNVTGALVNIVTNLFFANTTSLQISGTILI